MRCVVWIVLVVALLASTRAEVSDVDDTLDEQLGAAESAFALENAHLLEPQVQQETKQPEIEVPHAAFAPDVSSPSSPSSPSSSSSVVVVPWPPVVVSSSSEELSSSSFSSSSSSLYSARAVMSPQSFPSYPAFAIPVLTVSSVVLLASISCLVLMMAAPNIMPSKVDMSRYNVPIYIVCGVLMASSIAGIVVSSIAISSSSPSSSLSSSSSSSPSLQRLQLNNQRVYEVPVRVRLRNGRYATLTRRFTYVRDARGKMRAVLLSTPTKPVKKTAASTTRRRVVTTKRRTAKPRGRSEIEPSSPSSPSNVPINVPLSGSAVVGSDGLLTLEHFTTANNAGRASSPSTIGDRVLAIYMVTLSGPRPCGTVESPAACEATCPQNDLQQMLFDGPKSVSAFYNTASNGQFKLLPSNPVFVPVTLDGSTRLLDMPKVMEELKLLLPNADFHSLFLPRNYKRDLFSGDAAGLGMVGDKFSWLTYCDFSVFVHENGHNLGLHHSGAYNGPSFYEYGDYSSIMSVGVWNGDWRGLSAMQLQQLGWLNRVLSITTSGTYTISSASQYDETREARAATIASMDPLLWIEWRQQTNHDQDLKAASDRFAQDAPNTPDRYRGALLGTLLLKTKAQNGVTQLLATIDPGKKAQIGQVQIEYVDNGTFIVSGL